jgi:hypothetical protein
VPPSQRDIAVVWPALGVDESTAYRQQAPFSTPSASNVWPRDTLEGRQRGGSRPGLVNHYAPSAKTLVQAIAEVTVLNGATTETRMVAIIDGKMHFQGASSTTELSGSMDTGADLQVAFHNQKAFVADTLSTGIVKVADLTAGTPAIANHVADYYALKVYVENGVNYPIYRYDAAGQGVWDRNNVWYPGWPHTTAGLPSKGPFYTRTGTLVAYSSGSIYLSRWGGDGSAVSQFGGPGTIRMSELGEIYATDQANNRVQVFSAAGAFLRAWGVPGSGNGEFNSPLGLSVRRISTDPDVYRVYVADQGNFRVQYFTGDGDYEGQFGSTGTGNGQFGTGMRKIAQDSAGNVYVLDAGNSRIQKFNATGTYISQFGSAGTGNSQFTALRSFTLDSSDNLYVADATRIQKFDSSHNFVASVTHALSGQVWDLRIDPAGQFLWASVVDSAVADLAWYTLALVPSGTLNSLITGTEEGSFDRPASLTWSVDGTTLYVLSNRYIVRLGDPRGAARFVTRVEESDGVRETYDYASGDPLNVTVAMALVGRYKGIVPLDNPLICRWQDRIVLAGNPGHVWYMSRINDPADWDYGRPSSDIARAIAGQSSYAGTISEPITALIPVNDEYMMFAGLTSLWVMRGNPAYGGTMTNVSENVGCVGPNAWCRGPQGEVYVLSLNGLFLVRSFASENLQALSSRIPERLRGKTAKDYRISMAFDRRSNGFHVYVSPRSGGTAEHYFVDAANYGFWPMAFSAANTPTACARVGEELMVGCGSGTIRRYSDAQIDDNGTDFASHVVLGPWKCAPGFTNEGMINDMDGTLGVGSGAVTWEVYAGDFAERVADDAVAGTTPFDTGTWLAGHNYRDRPRARGMYAALRLESNGSGDAPRWAFETAVIRLRDAGRIRLL